MLLTNANRDRPYTKVPKRFGETYHGKRSGFTDNAHSYYTSAKVVKPEVPRKKEVIRQRIRQAKAELKQERARTKALREEHKRIEAKLEFDTTMRNTIMLERKDGHGDTTALPKGTRNGMPYYGRVWCKENRTLEEETLRPTKKAGPIGHDQMFTVLHRMRTPGPQPAPPSSSRSGAGWGDGAASTRRSAAASAAPSAHTGRSSR